MYKHSSALFFAHTKKQHSFQPKTKINIEFRGRGLNDDADVGTHCPYGHSNFTADSFDSSSEASS